MDAGWRGCAQAASASWLAGWEAQMEVPAPLRPRCGCEPGGCADRGWERSCGLGITDAGYECAGGRAAWLCASGQRVCVRTKRTDEVKEEAGAFTGYSKTVHGDQRYDKWNVEACKLSPSRVQWRGRTKFPTREL